MRTGILGGTFDPIHIAHLHAAECALHQLGLDRVLLVPAGHPWQKFDRFVSSASHRLEMCRLAIAGVAEIEVDDREVVRDGPTYTVDTLATFPIDEELFLILGSDSAAGLKTWHRWEAVVERATVVVAPRLGIRFDPADLPGRGALLVEMGVLEVSGTDIRKRVVEGRPFRYLVTAPVHAYIEANKLYTQAPEDDMVGGLNRTEDSS